MYCHVCGKEVSADTIFCPHCGKRLKVEDLKTNSETDLNSYISSKSRLTATLLCIFLGILGIHRFYTGKIGTGILWLFTLGFLGIGTFIDLLLLLTGNFEDKEGKIIEHW